MSVPPPEYRVYRSRRGLMDRLRGEGGEGALRRLQRRRGKKGPDEPKPRRRMTPGRVIKYLALTILAWIAISALAFFVSAQLQPGVDRRTERVLGSGGPRTSLLFGSTVLVLGSDERPAGTKEPGAGGPSRADSILLLRAGLGSVKRLSILRDSYTEIPGHGAQKINSSYALGGPALTARTVEGFLGNDLEINHVVEVSFDDFPKLINAMGGVNVTLKRCVRSDPFGGRKFSLGRGKHRLNGRQALSFARVRKNRCAPNENDAARASRQQQVLSSMRSRMLSPLAFPRLPLVAWQAPRTMRTDMRGPGLAALFTDLVTGGSGQTRVLEPSGEGPGGSLLVSELERREAVDALVGR